VLPRRKKMIPNKNGILEFSNEPIDSNFKIVLKEEIKGKNTKKFWNETIKYTSKIDNKKYNYTQPLGETIVAFMNNYEAIFNIISKYDLLFDEIEYNDYEKSLRTILNLRKEILKYGKNLKVVGENKDIEEKSYFKERDMIKEYKRDRTDKIFAILIFHIDSFITRLKDENKNNIEGPQVCCINFLQYLNYEIRTAYIIINTTFVRTSIKDNKLIISNKKYMDINQLKLPPVKIKYLSKKDKTTKFKVIDKYEYEIYSLNNLVDVSLHHINYNKKAILKCINCEKYFIPTTYEVEQYNDKTGNDEKKEISERITKLTCSEKCLQILRQNKEFMNNNKDLKTIRKNLRDKLRKRDNKIKKMNLKSKDLLLTFTKDYDEKEKELKEIYKGNIINIENELLKFIKEESIKLDELYKN
jgi:hypothetical protein